MGSIMDAAGWSGFAALRANGSGLSTVERVSGFIDNLNREKG